jgi:hypothetical protein
MYSTKNYLHAVKNIRQIKAETPLRNFKKIIKFVYKKLYPRRPTKAYRVIFSFTSTAKACHISTQSDAEHLVT